jgi:ubiquinone/menaquinone biosynthesis C-methylase UbiE
MSENLRNSMFEYYGQRAPEFDDFYLGGGPASISDPQAYRDEVEILASIVKRMCAGNVLDIACGTAFWLPHYAGCCSHITLFDQSTEMLAAAKARATSVGVADHTTVLSGDALTHDFGQAQFDTAVVAFLISHFTTEQEAHFFKSLRQSLKPGARVVILDSVWNDARAQTREKEGPQERTLADGRQFEVYKKYFDEAGLSSMASVHDIDLRIEHFGNVFFAAVATMETG